MKNDIKSIVIDVLETIIISAIIVFIIMQFVFISVKVEGTSMEPNLNDGDFGFSFVISKNMGINRFDIVVIDSEKSQNRLVKRVIGLPNETIEYYDNVLYVNGEAVEEEFLDENTLTPDFTYTLKDDEYFVLGDNREVSKDSRYYGTFSLDDFVSSHVFVIWPFSHFGMK